ncbi:MAG: hypothetical protein HYT87_06265 [Nitrospirae bacterium]|nr:hypothetical protein [Nitrospirota bacterium]
MGKINRLIVLALIALFCVSWPGAALSEESPKKSKSVLDEALSKCQLILDGLEKGGKEEHRRTSVIGVRAGKPAGAQELSDDPEISALQKQLKSAGEAAARLRGAVEASSDPKFRADAYKALSDLYGSMAEAEKQIAEKTGAKKQPADGESGKP